MLAGFGYRGSATQGTAAFLHTHIIGVNRTIGCHDGFIYTGVSLLTLYELWWIHRGVDPFFASDWFNRTAEGNRTEGDTFISDSGLDRSHFIWTLPMALPFFLARLS